MQKAACAVALLVSLPIAAPGLASEPGAPMDCADLELAPGLTCSEITEPLEDSSFGELPDTMIDNEGRVLVLFIGELGAIVGNCGTRQLRHRDLVVAFDGEGNATTLVGETDRCVDPSRVFTESIQAHGALFDPVRGSLILHLSSRCQIGGTGGGGCPYDDSAPPGPHSQALSWVARIDGFTPLAHALPPQCRNGLDDDGDGKADVDDPHCKSDADNDEARP